MFAIALSAMSLFSACSENPEESTGSIVGMVTEAPEGSESISGVTVSVVSNGKSTTTGSTGTFSFLDLQPGQYSLRFAKSGYTSETRTVLVVAGLESKCDVQLSRVSQVAEITFSPSALNFGTNLSDMSLQITNNGNTATDWSIDLGTNNWLSVSQTAGSIQAGKTQSITFSVDRRFLSESKSIVVNLHAFGNSYPISVSCAPRNVTSEMVIEPTVLNFGKDLTQKTFTIRNTGTSVLNWSLSGLNTPALSLSATQGAVSAGGSTVVVATLDRGQLSGELATTLIISDGIQEQTITISANGTVQGDEENNENDDNSQQGGVVVPNGLYAYFKFNGDFQDSGENDLSGYGYPEPSFTNGVTDDTKAIAFSRSKASAFIVSESMIDSRSMSITFWAKDITDGNVFYVTSANKRDNDGRMMMLCYRDGHLKYVVSQYHLAHLFDNTGNFTHKNIEDGQWHHIAIVSDYHKLNFSQATTSLYIDGKLMDTITEEVNSASENSPSTAHYGQGLKFTLGGENVPNMKIANMRVYDSRQLSANEISEIYKAKQ